MLTPMDIHDHQFKKSFRGYSENEVDDFLDRVVDDFEKLLRDNERLKSQVYANDKELEHYRKLEKTLNDTLMVAQRTADEVITAARKNADDMKEAAARECQRIQEEARLDAKRKIDSALTKRDAILSEYDKFVREKKAFLVKLRTILESELTITTQMIDDVPQVDELFKNILTEEEVPAPVKENSAPVENPAPVKEIPAPVENPAPVKENPASVENPAPVKENPALVKEIPASVENPAPVKEIPPPVKKAQLHVKKAQLHAKKAPAHAKKAPPPAKEAPVEEDYLPNLVDVSTKPVAVKKSSVNDDTKTYDPVKLDKESSK